MFELLTAMEQDSNWDDYECYDDVRMPAFIMERFFSIWLRHQCTRRRLRVLELPGYKLRFRIRDDQAALDTMGCGLELLKSTDPQVMAAVCGVFSGFDMALRLCFCMQELRCHPARPELMRLLHAEPGQPTLQRLPALLQIDGG